MDYRGLKTIHEGLTVRETEGRRNNLKESGVYVYACVKTTAAKPRELILNHYFGCYKGIFDLQ